MTRCKSCGRRALSWNKFDTEDLCNDCSDHLFSSVMRLPCWARPNALIPVPKGFVRWCKRMQRRKGHF